MWEKLQSRKLWAVVAGATLAALGKELGIPEESISGIIAIIVGYIVGQGAVDVAKEIKGKDK